MISPPHHLSIRNPGTTTGERQPRPTWGTHLQADRPGAHAASDDDPCSGLAD